MFLCVLSTDVIVVSGLMRRECKWQVENLVAD